MRNNQRIVANRDIRQPSVRVVSNDGSEVMLTKKALEKAEQAGLDLVVINEQADVPICKIVDLNKFKYEQQRREKEAARSQRENRVTIKEVQFKLNIDEHDFDVKCRNIGRFITKGNKVKLLVQFRGRERQHSDLGFDIIDRVLNQVDGIELDGKPQFSGNRITAMIKGSPNGAKTTEQTA